MNDLKTDKWVRGSLSGMLVCIIAACAFVFCLSPKVGYDYPFSLFCAAASGTIVWGMLFVENKLKSMWWTLFIGAILLAVSLGIGIIMLTN